MLPSTDHPKNILLNFSVRRSNDSPSKAIAAGHTEAPDRSNISLPFRHHYAHDFFAHRTAPG